MKRNVVFALALFSVVTLSACSNTIEKPTAQSTGTVTVIQGESRQSIAPDQTYARSINATFTIKKSVLMNQDFFYGADLQYSSIYDKDVDLYSQSSASGHIPCFFRENGSELQLVADNRRLFPSDVNHPEAIISRFTIISQTTDSYVLSEANSAEYLVTTIDSEATSPRDHWARSFQYVENGNYILQESSIVMQDGTTAEIMESIFPRQTLAVSGSFEKFKLDPTDPVGASDGPAARYRFLQSESIYDGEDQLAYAEHFDIGNNATIDWYATANISDAHLEVAKEAVEGWNRYFKVMTGISREVVKFKGRLPNGIKMGDPRFNVINWDSRLVAGAAYESQATDPFSGKQSHSLIYMPVAWFQIGMDYWTNGQYTDKERTAKTSKLLKKYAPQCLRDLSGLGSLLHSGRMSQQDAETFSVELMKQTLFHEVGHALGLAHNFKGSLSFDRTNPQSLFSSSIMDYNDYEIERAAFKSPTSADGPLLEYDRQALSAIYNKMSDVKASDAVVPACNDAEADTEASGKIDPLCMRYDIEKDPTLSVVTALDRVNKAAVAGDVTLSESLIKVKDLVLTSQALKDADTKDKYVALVMSLLAAEKGVLSFYFLDGKASLAATVRSNVKSLYIFESGILPEGYSEREMRERAYSGIVTSLAMKDLSVPVKSALEKVAAEGSAELSSATYILNQGGPATTAVVALTTKIKTILEATGPNFVKDPSGLVRAKRAVMSELVRVPTLPLFFGKLSSVSYDYETNIVSQLYEVVSDKTRAVSERHTGAVVLATYAGRGVADELIKKAVSLVDLELAAAGDTASREAAIALETALKKK